MSNDLGLSDLIASHLKAVHEISVGKNVSYWERTLYQPVRSHKPAATDPLH